MSLTLYCADGSIIEVPTELTPHGRINTEPVTIPGHAMPAYVYDGDRQVGVISRVIHTPDDALYARGAIGVRP